MIDHDQIEAWKDRLMKGDIPTLARSITLIESQRKADQKKKTHLLKSIQDIKTSSVKIGITGSPGVGKSTFLNAFISLMDDRPSKVAVLTIDPSSVQTGGSILGDKLRMKDLTNMENVFIRPSPSKGILGGVNLTTWETIQLCEAAGFNYIFIETVGVGQSEIEVQYLVNEVWYLTMARSGDEIQGIKRGILEVVDRIIVTKSDLDPYGAQNTKALLKQTLKSISDGKEKIKFYEVSALKSETLQILFSDFGQISAQSINLRQRAFWFDKGWQETIKQFIDKNLALKKLHNDLKHKINSGKIDHWTAMSKLRNELEELWEK